MMRRLVFGLIAITLASCATLEGGERPATALQPFKFIVVGDTAYNPPADDALYADLIAAINRRRPSFTIHVGDTKGAGPCDDAFQQRVFATFKQFSGPLIYTPGDNEWTDCHKPVNGSGDPVERLAAVRRIFFKDGFSLGGSPIRLERQSADPRFAAFPENRRWWHGEVLFATVHVVGSQNANADPDEFKPRQAADLAWIRSTFALAKMRSAKAVVFAFQADMFARPPAPDDGFADIRTTLRDQGGAAGLPVLLVHGDGHRFIIDRPFYDAASNGSLYAGENTYRLETFGAPELAAVEVTVTPGLPSPFAFAPIYGPQNPALTAGR
jgi:hypothetical protein